eukprot:3225959-Rhodomonas_salina.4
MFKGVCFKASTLEANSDALPDDCKAYQPHEEWTEADWWSVARSQARGSGDGGSRVKRAFAGTPDGTARRAGTGMIPEEELAHVRARVERARERLWLGSDSGGFGVGGDGVVCFGGAGSWLRCSTRSR